MGNTQVNGSMVGFSGNGWTHAALYVDQSSQSLKMSINQKILATVSFTASISSLASQVKQCQIGGGNLTNGVRHMVFASGLKTKIEDYHSRYANTVISPLDPNIVNYLSFENDNEMRN